MTALPDGRSAAPSAGALLRSHGVSGLGVLAVIAGLTTMVLGWAGADSATELDVQLAFLASGALLGLGIVAVGCGLLLTSSERHATRDVARAWRVLAVASRGLVADTTRAAAVARDEVER